MKKSFSLFLALRYLKPKRTFVSLITIISILGVTLGITVLILVISVMSGFELELQQKVIGFDAHIIVNNGGLLENWKETAKAVQSVPGVVAVAPYTLGRVMAEFDHHRLAPLVRGIDPEKESQITDIKKYIVAGELDLDGDKCVVGLNLAEQLGLSVGSKLNLTSAKNVDAIIDQINRAQKEGSKDPQLFENIKQMILPAELTVTGIFESGRYLYDSDFVLVPLYVGQEMYELDGGEVHGLAVRTTDPFTVEATKHAIMERIGPPNLALTWVDQNKELFDAIRMERGVMFFLLMFIVLVAAFGIMNTLITVTVQKTREIGILKALGARTGQIVGIFLAQGMVVGFFGTLTGLGLGMTLIRFRNETRDFLATVLHVQVFPASVYQFSEIPAKVVPSDVAIICVSAFVICSLAALIPAYFAARLDPVKALRYE
ncbi:MAG: ABC transporter permease [Terrimicrobiaceae bacterium]|nr:ABC transporter permease [Terrimicrobiaceae bacterium]